MMNRIIIMGRITADLEMQQTNSGKEYINFSVAVDQPPRENGEKQTDFFRCTAWGGTAGFISKYFGKGAMILLEGSMHNDDYTDKDGVKRYGMKLTVSNAYFTGEGKKQDSGFGQPGKGYGIHADAPLSGMAFTARQDMEHALHSVSEAVITIDPEKEYRRIGE